MSIVHFWDGAATAWAATTAYNTTAPDYVNSTTLTHVVTFECTTSGTSGGTEPAWDTTPGNTTNDGTVVWTARAPDSWTHALITRQRAWYAWLSGDKVYMAQDHAESNATSQTYSSSATLADRLVEYRVNRTSGLYDISDATVNFTITGGSDFSHTSSMAIHGARFSTGDDFRLYTTVNSQTVNDIQVELTSANAIFAVGGAQGDNVVKMNGGNIDFSNATGGYILSAGSTTEFNNVDFLGNAVSTGLFRPANTRPTKYLVPNSDLTALSSATLVDMSAAIDSAAEIIFAQSSLPSSYTVSDSVFSNDNQIIRLIACDIDGASNAKRYKNEFHTYRGTTKDNITTYLNAFPGHEDSNTKFSFEMATGNNGTNVVTPWSPLEGIELQAYISSTGSKTFTVEAVENFTSALDVDEAWMEVYYLGTANSTKNDVGTTKGNLLTTALTAGTGLANWTGPPSGSRSVKFEKTLTVNEPGVYGVKIFLGAYESGKVLHYTPKVTVT